MTATIQEVAHLLESRGDLRRARADHAERIIAHVRTLLGRDLPADLIDFYNERIARIGEFQAQAPIWNDYIGRWKDDDVVTWLLGGEAVPLFDDGCGNYYGLDLTPGATPPAVYFFDHEHGFHEPVFAAGSSLGVFLLLLANHDRSYNENWPERWELKIDPGIERCPRAPAIWATD